MLASARYGQKFMHWADSDNRKPYNSYGNGSTMRGNHLGFIAESPEETLVRAFYESVDYEDATQSHF